MNISDNKNYFKYIKYKNKYQKEKDKIFLSKYSQQDSKCNCSLDPNTWISCIECQSKKTFNYAQKMYEKNKHI